MKEFGQRVRALRMAAGKTQAELAEAAGISERTISDLERGLRSSVYPATARRLADALSVGQDNLANFLLSAQGQEPAAPAFDTGRAPAAYRSQIPVRPNRLIGRGSELAQVLQLVRDPEVRLITLVGPGGVGKTRLATEVAAITQDEFSGGVYFINLSVIDDPALVVAAIATGIGVLPSKSAEIALLSRRLAQGRSMIVLDTFEHLRSAVPHVAELVAACPGLTLLTTTRAALNLRAEREVPLRPLAVESTGGEGAEAPPAAVLFFERARAVAPDLPAQTAASEVVREICARLDGLPLALELAGARVKHMTLPDLLQNLERRLDALSEGSRDMPPRHQTMRAALDWSYAQLGGAELRLFRCLGVFRGGFTREAVNAVATPGDAEDRARVLATLSLLVNASLVSLDKSSTGESRYRLLDLVREYAVERAVAAGDRESLRQRHAHYFLSLAERAEPELRGPHQREWHERLLADEGNFRAAVSWAFETGRAEVALRLAGALWMFWRWAGLFTEARAWLETALRAGESCPLEIRMPAFWAAGWLAFHQEDFGRTGEIGRQMLGLLPAADRGPFRRHALTLVGNAAVAEGRSAEAVTALGEAVAIAEQLGNRWVLATSLLNLGAANLKDGRTAESRDLFERALSIYEEIGDRHFTARTLTQLANTALADGYTEGAKALSRRAAEISAQLGDAWGVAETIEAAANARSEADPESAAMLAGAAERLRDHIAMRQHPVDAYINNRHLEAARRSLGSDAFQAAWTRGRTLSAEQAIAVVLGTGH